MSSLNATARVILGLLKFSPRTGYDVKRVTDFSTRFFWRASYGQIYPELRRLVDEGLVEGEERPTGSRMRTLYRLTPAGRDELVRWLDEPGAGYELRDLGLLKLFFADADGDEERVLAAVRELRADRAHVLERLLAVEVDLPESARESTVLVLEYGIAMHRWLIGWCDDVERRKLVEREPAGRS